MVKHVRLLLFVNVLGFSLLQWVVKFQVEHSERVERNGIRTMYVQPE
jgi:hypothetical protein